MSATVQHYSIPLPNGISVSIDPGGWDLLKKYSWRLIRARRPVTRSDYAKSRGTQGAAARDLYTALKSLTRWLAAHHESNDEFYIQSMEMAHAAIAKALPPKADGGGE